MSGWGKYVWAALGIAALSHFALISAVPHLLTGIAISRLSEPAGINQWMLSPRITEDSRTIVRPAPDFAYSVCVYDLSRGPVRIRVAPWGQYWSLSLYGANSDNFFVLNDRETRDGAGELVIVRAGKASPEGSERVAQSPSARGVALIRRLAPTADTYEGAAEAARGDVCAAIE